MGVGMMARMAMIERTAATGEEDGIRIVPAALEH